MGLRLARARLSGSPDGARAEPDLSWLSPEQVAELGPVLPRTVTVCPVFVGEIMSETDRLLPLQRKMERYLRQRRPAGLAD